MKYKRLSLILLIIFTLYIPTVFAVVTPELSYSYPEVNANAQENLQDEHPSNQNNVFSAVGQSFNATENAKLESVSFLLYKSGNPVNNATAALYAHAGVFGTNGVPTGNALAISNEYELSQLTGSEAIINFQFSYDQQYDLVSGTQYFIVFRTPSIAVGGVSNLNYPLIRYSSPGGVVGNYARYDLGGWTAAARDAIFYLYTVPQPYVAQDTTQFQTETWNWVNVTVRDGAGIAHFQTVDIEVNTTLDTETFTHRWTQATGVFSTTADLLNVTTIDAVRSRTIVVDSNTSIIAFRFQMHNATTGYCDVQTIGTDDVAAVLNFMQLSEFNYAGVSWTAVGDALDSAFSFWGIQDFMDKAAAYINGLSGYFTVGLTNIVELVAQQMRLMLAFVGGFIKVFTNIVTAMLTLWDTAYSIVNGTSGLIDLGIGNFWEWIAFGTWSSAFYLLLIVYWAEDLDKRARGTGRNTINVIIQDVNQAINLTSFFVSTFAFIVNEVANWSLRLFDAITGVIPV